MKYYILSFVVVCFAGCSPDQTPKPYAEIVFQPAFLFASSFKIYGGDTVSIDMTILKESEEDDAEVRYRQSFNITPAELQSFVRGLNTFNKTFRHKQLLPSLDGVTVTLRCDALATADNTTVCWSPRRTSESEYYHFIDPFFLILRNHLHEGTAAHYGSMLEEYFDSEHPDWPIKADSSTFTLYGRLSPEPIDLQKLEDALNGIPRTRPITIDMSNFLGMDTLHYPFFSQFITRNKQITWLANPAAYEVLTKLSVPDSAISKVKNTLFD